MNTCPMIPTISDYPYFGGDGDPWRISTNRFGEWDHKTRDGEESLLTSPNLFGKSSQVSPISIAMYK